MEAGIDLDAIALEIKALQDTARQVQPYSKRLKGFGLASAYDVAARIHRARLAEGAIPVGRKIGFTNPDMWVAYGVREPVWGYVYDRTVVYLQDLPADCSLGKFSEPKIEPEIVFHFRSDLSPAARMPDILKAIDWVAHGFEIVQSHFPGWQFEAPDTVADSALHGMLLVGPPRPFEVLGEDPVSMLKSLSVNLICGDQLVEAGKGSNVLGHPFEAIAHLLSVLGRHPDRPNLKAGEIVSTGTMTTAHSIDVGQTWRSEVVGAELANLAIRFVP